MEGKDLIRFVKSRRISWVGHVLRMDGKGMPRRMLEERVDSKKEKRATEDKVDGPSAGGSKGDADKKLEEDSNE